MLIKRIGATTLIRLETGEEAIAALRAWAEREGVGFAALQAIGALQRATLAHFDPAARAYTHISVAEQTEVVSLVGNVSWGPDGAPVVHAHALLGRRDGSAVGGHLIEGVVSPTLEVVLLTLPERVERQEDAATGLRLWKLTR